MRIAMHAASLRHWGKLHPSAPFEDVPSPAGTELAMMAVATGLVQLGHQVRVFADCEGQLVRGVEYLPADMALPFLTTVEHDVIVSWQDVGIFLYPLKAKLKVLMSQSSQLGVGQVDAKIDRYFGISRFSAQTLLNSDSYACPEKMWVTRNGVFLERFLGAFDSDRNRHRIVWGSSPDRGLHHLVDIFPKVKKAVPDAELVVMYEFDRTLNNYQASLPGSAYVRWLEKAAELKAMDGVTITNHISQPKVADILMHSGVFVYPCDPLAATETYCVAVTEAMAAGLPCVISDQDCLKENYDGYAQVLPLPVDPDVWAERIILLMTSKKEYAHWQKKSLQLAQSCANYVVAGEWEAFFTDYLNGHELTMDRSLRSHLEAHRVVETAR